MSGRHLVWLMVLVALLGLSACDDHDDHDGHKGHGDHKEEGHKDDDHDEDKHDKDKHDEDGHKDEGHEGGKHGEEGHEDEEGKVHLSKDAIARSGLRVAKVEAGALSGSVVIPAEVQLNPDRVAHISPLVDGQIFEVSAAVGDTVVAEHKLVRLRSVDLGQARAELSRSMSLVSVARKNHDRQKKLRKEGINSERSLLEARLIYDQALAERTAAHSRLKVYGVEGGSGPNLTLNSPIEGVILKRHATLGENVGPDDTLFVVADLKRVWVIGRVYERQIIHVRPGMAASLTLVAYPGRTWKGKVDYIASSLDEATRTLAVRIELSNEDGFLRPGLFGSLRLEGGSTETTRVPVIPETAVQTMKNKTVVFAPHGDEEGEFEMVPVTLGRAVSGSVEVLEGLEAGQEIVVEGAFVLKSELMRSELGHGHAH